MYVKTKVTSKYQITLPKNVRKKLKIEKGDAVVFEGKEDEVIMRVEKTSDPVEAIAGILEGEDIEGLRTKTAKNMLKKKLGLE